MKERLELIEQNQRNNPSSVEESFRASLEDVVAILERMAPTCNNTMELVEVVKLGLTNDGQFRLLMGIITKKPGK